jgi:hypothetical protein
MQIPRFCTIHRSVRAVFWDGSAAAKDQMRDLARLGGHKVGFRAEGFGSGVAEAVFKIGTTTKVFRAGHWIILLEVGPSGHPWLTALTPDRFRRQWAAQTGYREIASVTVAAETLAQGRRAGLPVGNVSRETPKGLPAPPDVGRAVAGGTNRRPVPGRLTRGGRIAWGCRHLGKTGWRSTWKTRI